jgi:carotenoid cleavage dioxygenase
MPKFIPVPWIRWQRHRITGVVRELDSERPLPDLRIAAYDKDLVKDDFLGEATTDANGAFEIRFTDADFKDLVESKPDIYLCVFCGESVEPIHDTRCEIRENASHEEHFELHVPADSVDSVG